MAQDVPEGHGFHELQTVALRMKPVTETSSAARTTPRVRIVLKYAIGLPRGAQLAPGGSIAGTTQQDTMANNSSAAATTAPGSFEEAMAELAQLVTQMEGGQLPLEASVAAYARGSELVKYCAAQLERVESQVKILEGDMLKPFSVDGAGEGDR
jgi:exodeoxyribonuclease VII small subunit